MGLVYADIELISGDDDTLSRRGFISESDVKKISISALVDSGAYMLAINETIRTQLDLQTVDTQTAELADGSQISLDIVAPIIVKFANRATTCRAMVLPGNSEVLLGAIPMEDMDVVINPKEQKLTVNPAHPYIAHKPLK
ncbi:MAG: clan AA aspartic protease [Candidatus Kapabacteria bacterium]|nr:clan AA aspartic protease [Candidatus Kapabacteria bacterium]